MEALYLTYPSAGFFTVALLAATFLYFLLRMRSRLEARGYLIAYFVIWLVFNIAYMIGTSFLAPWAAYSMYGVLTVFFIAPVFAGFVYSFPFNIHRRESKIVVGLMLLLTTAAAAYPVYLTYGRSIHFNVAAQFYFFKGAGRALLPVQTVFLASQAWILIVIVRKAMLFRRRYVKQFIAFAVATLATFAVTMVSVFTFLNDAMWAPFYVLLCGSTMLVQLLFYLALLGHARVSTPFLDRLLSVALSGGTLLFLAISASMLAMARSEVEEIRYYTAELIGNLARHDDYSAVPDYIHYVLEYTEDGAVMRYTGQGLSVDDLIVMDFKLARGQQLRIRFVDQEAPSTYFLENVFDSDGRRFGVGFAYLELREAIHELAALLMGLSVFITGGVFTFLPFAYRRIFARRLDSLLQGMERVNAGDLKVHLPVPMRDEIGLLTRYFNIMTGSLRRMMRDRERLTALEKELSIAKNIQLATLPENYPRIPGLTVHGRYVPMDAIGGDFYDFFEAGDGLGVLIADVCGHGVPAALGASMVKVAFAGQYLHARRPDRLLDFMNNTLIDRMSNGFVTASYLFLDLRSRRLSLSAAGHPPVLLHHRNGGRPEGEPDIRELSVRGIGIGIKREYEYRLMETDVHPGDRLVMYTDGIIECRNRDGEMFGEDRFHDLLRLHANLTAETLTERCFESLHEWADHGRGFDDDFTIVVVDVA